MKVIGVTGGVGAGKSAILDYIEANFRAKVLKADEIAHGLMAPQNRCYHALREVLPEHMFLEDGALDRKALSAEMFQRKELRDQVNDIVHPAVKVEILDTIAREQRTGALDYLVVEAALLIEDGYGEICDELWYVHASKETRRKRLMENRGYTKERVEEIFASQLSEQEYRRRCRVVIENDKAVEYAYFQVLQELNDEGDTEMDMQQLEEKLVFGLDIGTRNIVGTVGYKKEDEFFVVAQCVREHETRSMLDGQIHDISRVGRSIIAVKQHLESQIGLTLREVCIAAAGRVLKTVTTSVEYEFEEDTVVEREHIHTLELLGVDKAQQILNENNDTKFRFYSVGYSVMKYYANEELYSNLESHKAKRISADIIVTFLPEEVVDDLYSAVGIAGLNVASLTLEPIAAINVAIPEAFRMLNIALVDVGAGTSDISVTKEGSIIAYGMIPSAGDEITELIVQNYLVDFKTAEHIKLTSGISDEVTYTDIMSISHTIPSTEVWELVAPLVDKLVKDVASKIKELNGDVSVSAAFVVGGGGKVHDFVKRLAEELDLPQERVALRGEEVLREVHFEQKEIKKDPLLVTPIGICLNYYDQRNNFIFTRFNGERIKLYDNGRLTVVDAAMEAGFPNEQLFPRRGKEINFTLDGKGRIARGEAGESAIVKVNGTVVNINSPLEQNAEITIVPSTAGADASCRLDELAEYSVSTLSFEVNGRTVRCPKFFEVNGSLEPPFYQIQEGDRIETRSYYTVGQVMEFMDVEIDLDQEIQVNNRPADLNTLVYENFSIDWTVLAYRTPESEMRRSWPEEGWEKYESLQLDMESGKQEESDAEKQSKTAPAKTLQEPKAGSEIAGESQSGSGAGSMEEIPSGSGFGTKANPSDSGLDTEERQSDGEADAEERQSDGEADAEERQSDGEADAKERQSDHSAGAEGEPSGSALSVEGNSAGGVLGAENTSGSQKLEAEHEGSDARTEETSIIVTANGDQVTLTGKESYVLVDIFEFISFDLNAGNGRRIVVKLNGETPSYMQGIGNGDVIEIYWQEK